MVNYPSPSLRYIRHSTLLVRVRPGTRDRIRPAPTRILSQISIYSCVIAYNRTGQNVSTSLSQLPVRAPSRSLRLPVASETPHV